MIGEFAALTGATASFGQSAHRGVRMAIDEANVGGGVLGKKLRLVTEDDQSKAGEAATVVRRMISREKPVAIIGEVASSRSLEAAPICQQNKIPMISPASTNPKVTETGDYIFRVCFIDPFQGAVLAKFMLQRGLTKAAILTDVKQDYAVGLADFFKDYFTKNGGTIVSEQSYSSGDKDFKAQLTSIRSTNPEAILVAGYYNEAGLIASQARELEIKVPLLGGDGWDSPSLVEVAGEAMEGNFSPTIFRPRTSRLRCKTSSPNIRRNTSRALMPWRRWPMMPRCFSWTPSSARAQQSRPPCATPSRPRKVLPL